MSRSRSHISAVVAAYALWGVLPLYWKLFDAVAPEVVVAHRVIWSACSLALLLLFRGEFSASWRRFFNFQGVRRALPSAVLLGINWLTFLWAIAAHRVIEASLGYFICPLLTIALGAFFLKEKCSRLHATALVLITSGVIAQMFLAGTVPVLGLAMALSFSLYALHKKKSDIPTVEGLFRETALLSVPAVGYLVYHGVASELPLFSEVVAPSLLLASVGVVTIVPMLLFTWGVSQSSLRFVGIAQYLAPTIKLCLAVFIFQEPFGLGMLATYAFVWSGIALYLFGDVVAALLAKPLFPFVGKLVRLR